MDDDVIDSMGGRWIRAAGGWFSTRWPIRYVRPDSEMGQYLTDLLLEKHSDG